MQEVASRGVHGDGRRESEPGAQDSDEKEGRLAQLVRAPALQLATPHLFLSRSSLFSIALHPFRDSAFAQHRTLFGCSTCTFDTVLTQRRRFKGAPAVGRRSGETSCLRRSLMVHSGAEGLDCYCSLMYVQECVQEPKNHPMEISTEPFPGITQASSARLKPRGR